MQPVSKLDYELGIMLAQVYFEKTKLSKKTNYNILQNFLGIIDGIKICSYDSLKSGFKDEVNSFSLKTSNLISSDKAFVEVVESFLKYLSVENKKMFTKWIKREEDRNENN